MIEYKFLIVCVDGIADDAEKPEDLQVLLLMVVRMGGDSSVMCGQIVDDLLVDKVIHKEKLCCRDCCQR